MRIGIVVGSIRAVRKAESVAAWAYGHATARGDADYELVDLKAFDVPLLTDATHPMQAGRQYSSAQVTAWSRAVDACDGFVFVTPEYNHGVPGVRCVEHWRSSLANFQMVDVRQQVGLFLHTDFDGDGFTPLERRTGELDTMLDQLVAMTRRLRA